MKTSKTLGQQTDRVLESRNYWLYCLIQKLQIAMLRLLNTATVPLWWFKLTGIDDTKVEKELPWNICFNILRKIDFMAKNVTLKKNKFKIKTRINVET